MGTVLITGSSKGLGEKLARIFADHGYDIIIHGRNESNLMNISDQIMTRNIERGRENRVYTVVGDLRENETIDKLSKIAIEKKISILINNAAIGMNKKFFELDDNEIGNILKINLYTPISLIKRIYPMFKEMRSGTIINIIAKGSLIDQQVQTIYRASKLGLKGFTDNLRYESKLSGIRVVSVYPGGMQTDGYEFGDSSKCMDPKEVAMIIYDSIIRRDSCMTDEIHIGRVKY